ncbi:MAG: FlgD immunoglobulin-like domain containing protein [Candidatus Eiseniibacteriota bacterium]
MRRDRPPHGITVTAVAALALAPAVATAQLIDDFEAGPFSFGCGYPGCTYVQNIGSHGIEPTRSVTLWSNSADAQVTANLATTSFDDAAVFGFYAGTTSYANVSYDPPGDVDLTGGGTYEYIAIRASAVAGTKVDVEVTLDNGFYAVATADIDPSGTTYVGWTDFGVLTEQDFEAVDRFNFTFRNDTWFGWVDVTVWDIRLGRWEFGLWDGVVTDIVWCPTCPIQALIYDGYTSGLSAAYHMDFGPASVMGIDPQPFVTMTGFDSGGGRGMNGASAGSALYWGPQSYDTSTFEFLVEYTAGAGNLWYHSPDPVIVLNDGTSFELLTVLTVGGRYPAPVDNVLESFRFDIDPAQPLLFEDVAVTPLTPGPGVDGAWRVSFKLSADGTADVALPLFTTMMTADWAPAGTPTDAPLVAAPTPAALSAQPSVTAGPTRLVLSRPADARGEVSVLDVSGRLVRRLGIGAGASSVDWDGRGEAGRLLPPGVYFATLPGGIGERTARITVVR